METKSKVIKWIKDTAGYWAFSIYLILVSILAFMVFQKHMLEKPSKESLTADSVISIQQQIDSLEKQIEQQSAIIKILENKIEQQNENLTNVNRPVEKRIQAQTEVLKRLCEYIVVITVDKKIIPRQCLPEYRWNREDGN